MELNNLNLIYGKEYEFLTQCCGKNNWVKCKFIKVNEHGRFVAKNKFGEFLYVNVRKSL